MVTMKHRVVEIDVPAASAIARQLHDAEFFDCYEVPIAGADVSALAFYLNVVSGSPQWVNRLMALRNHIVGFVGLKNLGRLHDVSLVKTAADYRVGDRVGIFSLLSVTDDEVILGDSDKHLDVKVSVCKLQRGEHRSAAVSTVVHIHNLLGRVYMLFVAPVHRLIVPAVLGRAVPTALL